MKKLLCNYRLIFIILLLASCSGEKQKMIDQIESINKNVFNNKSMELDKELALKEITACRDFVEKYPDDTLSADYLFRMSDLERAVGNNEQAIDYLAEICKKYPDYKRIPDCIFLQGYYCQEFFNDTISAKKFYQELLSKYPNHAFADDAQELMKMFGKSDQEVIKEFEAKEAENKK